MTAVHFEISSRRQAPLAAEVQYETPNVTPLFIVRQALERVLPVKVVRVDRLSRVACPRGLHCRSRYRLVLAAGDKQIGFLLTVDS